MVEKTLRPQYKKGLFLLIGILIIYPVYLREYHYSIILFLGLAMGFIIQRSKICFTASMRDIILFRKTKVFRALLLGMIVATVGFGIKQGIVMNEGLQVPGQIVPVGLHTVLGGILFGIGMVIAGSCVSGTFTRIGEGYLLPWIVLLGLIIGTAFAIFTFGFWVKYVLEYASKIYLGNYISIKWIIPLQVIVLAIIYYWAKEYENRE